MFESTYKGWCKILIEHILSIVKQCQLSHILQYINPARHHSPGGVYTFSVLTVAVVRCSPDSWTDGVSCRLRTCKAGTARKSQPFCKCSSYGNSKKKKKQLNSIQFIVSTFYLSRGGDSTTPPFASLFFGFWREDHFTNTIVLLTVITYCCCCCCCHKWPPSAPLAPLHSAHIFCKFALTSNPNSSKL